MMSPIGDGPEQEKGLHVVIPFCLQEFGYQYCKH